MEATALRFATAARLLAQHARRHGLDVPGFRSPPRLAGADRSLRWRADGGATVAVSIRDRPWVAVLADMVEGVVAANRLAGQAADQARSALWVAVSGESGGAVVAA
jgi:hypothetical protein